MVARRLAALAPALRVVEHEGEPVDLIDAWAEQDEVIVVDAVSRAPRPARSTASTLGGAAWRRAVPGSTHALGVAEAIELGRALGRLPGGCWCSGSRAGASGRAPASRPRSSGPPSVWSQELRDRLFPAG